MSKIRLKFSKTGMGKYISHLDLLRTFTRAIHRAELPVRYSQGFNPHQLITFSLPLALGTTGEGEFLDIDFEDGTDPNEVKDRLNDCLPTDIRIVGTSLPEIKAKDIVSAEYIFTIKTESKAKEEDILTFFEQAEIRATKKTKRGEKEVNLREFIHEYSLIELSNTGFKLRAVLSAGGEINIKPGIVVDKMCEFLGVAKPENAEIHRKTIYYQAGKRVMPFE